MTPTPLRVDSEFAWELDVTSRVVVVGVGTPFTMLTLPVVSVDVDEVVVVV